MSVPASNACLGRTQSVSSSAGSAPRRPSLTAPAKRHSMLSAVRCPVSAQHSVFNPAPAPPRAAVVAAHACAHPGPASRPPAALPRAQPAPPGVSRFSPHTPPSLSCSHSHSHSRSARHERIRQSESSRFDVFDPEYHDEIIAHMHNIEESTRPSLNLIDTQPEVTWTMRPFLVDFMLEMHAAFDFRPETLHVGVGLLDRYLSKRVVLKKHYQLAGATAMWIAAKYEDAKDSVPTASELVTMCCNALDESAFHQMEAHILATLHYALGRPSHETWLRLYLHHAGLRNSSDPAGPAAIARMLLDCALYHRDMVPLAPSQVARGALCVAQILAGGRAWELQAVGTVALSPLLGTIGREAALTVQKLIAVLTCENVSNIVQRKHHAAFQKALKLICASPPSSAMLSPSPQKRMSVLATPPTRGRGAGNASMPSTPGLCLTPMTATTCPDEDDRGPLTPSTVLSPLPSTDGHGDVSCMTVDTSMDISMALSPSASKASTTHASPTMGPQIVVDPAHGH